MAVRDAAGFRGAAGDGRLFGRIFYVRYDKTFTFSLNCDKISKGYERGGRMDVVSYDGLYARLESKGLTKTSLVTGLGLSSRTVAKIAKGEKLSGRTLERIADYLECDIDSLCRNISSNVILQVLRDEKSARISGGLYHELQVRMTYNSNHIEGSRLTEDQTRLIFETNTIDAGDGISVDDILETVHHFRAIDYVIDVAEDELSEDIIKNLHYILKHDTKDSALDWFAVGDYKRRPNMVGGRETARPKDVRKRMEALLREYNGRETVTVDDVIAFHAEFESIHPFQDGNGRVGRLVALKECLRHDIVPFIIEDSKKYYYYRGLSKWRDEKGWLTDTCLDGQDTFVRLLDMLDIHHRGESVAADDKQLPGDAERFQEDEPDLQPVDVFEPRGSPMAEALERKARKDRDAWRRKESGETIRGSDICEERYLGTHVCGDDVSVDSSDIGAKDGADGGRGFGED